MIEKVHPPITESGVKPALLWAAFLGSSWTWIIGMVLPILLVADFGIMGWVVFAVPNVLGAGAMGFVLSNAEKSRKVSGKHRDMCLRFSEVTYTFHFFVIAWLFTKMFGMWGVGSACVLGFVFWMMAMRRPGTVVATVVVTSVSVVLALIGFFLPGAWTGIGESGGALRLDVIDLWMFLPASVFGFLLCPYLDLTFHRARQSTSPGVGKVSFAVGFGVVFFMMIIFSLAYSGLLRPLITEGGELVLGTVWIVILAIHMTMQAGYTIGLHAREMCLRMSGKGVVRLLAMAVGGLTLGAVLGGSDQIYYGYMTSGELGYRIFLMAYGLAFPGYVWLCMIPTIRKHVCSKGRVVTWAIATIVAAPFTFGSFVGGIEMWMVWTFVIMVIARVVVEMLPQREVAFETA